MPCCLTAPSHYLNQCWFIISEVLWGQFHRKYSIYTSSKTTMKIGELAIDMLIFTRNIQNIFPFFIISRYMSLNITNLRLQPHPPGTIGLHTSITLSGKKSKLHDPDRVLNSLGPSDAIWRQKTGSTLAQVMACCLTAPSHYLNQSWRITSKV